MSYAITSFFAKQSDVATSSSSEAASDDIWLDGAGNLHNAGLLAIFADSEEHTGIRVLEVNHNEGARSQVA